MDEQPFPGLGHIERLLKNRTATKQKYSLIGETLQVELRATGNYPYHHYETPTHIGQAWTAGNMDKIEVIGTRLEEKDICGWHPPKAYRLSIAKTSFSRSGHASTSLIVDPESIQREERGPREERIYCNTSFFHKDKSYRDGEETCIELFLTYIADTDINPHLRYRRH